MGIQNPYVNKIGGLQLLGVHTYILMQICASRFCACRWCFFGVHASEAGRRWQWFLGVGLDFCLCHVWSSDQQSLVLKAEEVIEYAIKCSLPGLPTFLKNKHIPGGKMC